MIKNEVTADKAPGRESPVSGSLRDQTIIITGAAGDVGAVYVHAFTAAGANVIAVDLRGAADAGRAIADSAARSGAGQAEFVPGDITSDSDWDTAVQRSLQRFGRLDVLINNAALYRGIERKRPLTELTVDDWDQVLAVNVRGTWQGIKASAAALAASGGGRIINVSSVVGRSGAIGFAHYVASKAAVEGLTRAAARELGPQNICVNAVAPGLISNSATHELNEGGYVAAAARGRALGRPMLPADLVGTMLWLASPAAGFITGQTIIVDGGQVFT
jgi:NAD(P)-dependent dehydrogenase (short-subunit alcohol dehydrogenase family)